jgi:hypothetical protein
MSQQWEEPIDEVWSAFGRHMCRHATNYRGLFFQGGALPQQWIEKLIFLIEVNP